MLAEELEARYGRLTGQENRAEAEEEAKFHRHRRAALAEASEEWRPALAKVMVSAMACPEEGTSCQNPASPVDGGGEAAVRCKHCRTGGVYLYQLCDVDCHPLAHMHERSIWSNGFWESIGPSEELNAAREVVRMPKVFDIAPVECSFCHGSNWLGPATTSQRLLYITLSGPRCVFQMQCVVTWSGGGRRQRTANRR